MVEMHSILGLCNFLLKCKFMGAYNELQLSTHLQLIALNLCILVSLYGLVLE